MHQKQNDGIGDFSLHNTVMYTLLHFNTLYYTLLHTKTYKYSG